MTDWIQSIATIILGAATIALFWVTKTLARSTNRLAHISGQDFRAKHSPIPFLIWHKDTPAIEGGNIVLKGAIRPVPDSPSMTLISILAESSVEIAGAGHHVETLHESWPGWPLALDHFHEFACPVPEVRAAATDLQIGVTVTVAPLVAPSPSRRPLPTDGSHSPNSDAPQTATPGKSDSPNPSGAASRLEHRCERARRGDTGRR